MALEPFYGPEGGLAWEPVGPKSPQIRPTRLLWAWWFRGFRSWSAAKPSAGERGGWPEGDGASNAQRVAKRVAERAIRTPIGVLVEGSDAERLASLDRLGVLAVQYTSKSVPHRASPSYDPLISASSCSGVEPQNN